MEHRIYHPSPRDRQIRRLQQRHGLTYRQAEIIAAWHFGEVPA